MNWNFTSFLQQTKDGQTDGQACMHTQRNDSMRQISSWEANSSQLAKIFPVFYGTRWFLATVTRAHHLSLPWAISIRVTIINYHNHNSLSFYDNLQCKPHQLPSQLRFTRDTIHNSSPHCRDSANDNSSDSWQGNLNLWSSCNIMWLHQPTTI